MSSWDFEAPQFYDFATGDKPAGSGDEWFDKKSKSPSVRLRKRISNKSLTEDPIKIITNDKTNSKKLQQENINKDLSKMNNNKGIYKQNLRKIQIIMKSCTEPKSPMLSTRLRIRNDLNSNKENVIIAKHNQTIGNNVKKSTITKIIPFSFETKDILIKAKREEAIKNDQLTQKMKQKAYEFKANPIPNIRQKAIERSTKPTTKPHTFNLRTEIKAQKINQINKGLNKSPRISGAIGKSTFSKGNSTMSNTRRAKPIVSLVKKQKTNTLTGPKNKTMNNVTKVMEFSFATDKRAQQWKLAQEAKDKKK
ncbi:unnamed protein product [Gordionus sp. m RMFG-2023]|uniref:uncharacterized protein LOC135922120 n=1 Tax=Gordionus sp. m RMFG-2023 TaxID=3053472 RepID=UPI0030DFEFCF